MVNPRDIYIAMNAEEEEETNVLINIEIQQCIV